MALFDYGRVHVARADRHRLHRRPPASQHTRPARVHSAHLRHLDYSPAASHFIRLRVRKLVLEPERELGRQLERSLERQLERSLERQLERSLERIDAPPDDRCGCSCIWWRAAADADECSCDGDGRSVGVGAVRSAHALPAVLQLLHRGPVGAEHSADRRVPLARGADQRVRTHLVRRRRGAHRRPAAAQSARRALRQLQQHVHHLGPRAALLLDAAARERRAEHPAAARHELRARAARVRRRRRRWRLHSRRRRRRGGAAARAGGRDAQQERERQRLVGLVSCRSAFACDPLHGDERRRQSRHGVERRGPGRGSGREQLRPSVRHRPLEPDAREDSLQLQVLDFLCTLIVQSVIVSSFLSRMPLA